LLNLARKLYTATKGRVVAEGHIFIKHYNLIRIFTDSLQLYNSMEDKIALVGFKTDQITTWINQASPTKSRP